MTFQIGDVLQLKSGGVAMTVEKVAGQIECVWSDCKRVFRDKFDAALLCKGPKTLKELIIEAGALRDSGVRASE